ncbi:long tail fiber [Salmonella phage GEC_vB_N3]|uniref:Long tail fiber n=2 Tax=Epseptimavirus TaxID=2732017 RepID=A0A7S9XET0_9CAUD|nr:long tail fiber [Salmonella phage GEC_vB_N3]QPI15607.1 long tail fiber [Salmonella phage GEC_vB_N7]
MALKTKIIVQQILNIDDTTTTASKYPKYTVVLGNSISSITAGELTAAVEASAASAAAAKDSEIAAKESETNAKDSENLANIYATSSETSATQSAASAAEADRQATLSEKSAEASATYAEESKGFRDSAELAAQNAETSRRLAEQAKTAAQQAQTAAETAKTGAETAKAGADAAATTAGEHAAAAKQSELNAKESEVNAAGSATEAGDKAIDATTEADRAKAEADRATQVVDGKLDKVDISGFIKVYKTKAEADADVANRVLDEKVLVWDQTDSKYGWYKVAGTAEAPVLELVETEQKLISINNVHADDAGNVQITLPGGNPSLWLGEVTWFPYNKDSGVGYPGVLPADGREVLRVDYPDTWEAIEAGLIPSVSEAEWQAGASLYFSTGDGSTTFRLPDMMQGQAFRAPNKGEEDAGAIKEQIPYITTVNGIGPADDTGAIKLPYVAMVNGAIVPDEDGNLALGNVVTKNVWDGVNGEVLLRGAFGLGGAGIALNEPNLVSFFKAMRAFGSGYYRNDTGTEGLPAYSAGFYSKTADTHSFICPQYSSGIVFVGTINDNVLDGESPVVHTNILYGTANKPDLNSDTQGILGISKGGTGATNIEGIKTNLGLENFTKSGIEARVTDPSNPQRYLYINSDPSNPWGAYDLTAGAPIPLSVRGGGTGATNAEGARLNLELGEVNTPSFAEVAASLYNGFNSGLLYMRNHDASRNLISYSSIYNELQSGVAKTTIRTTNSTADKTAFYQFDENGQFSAQRIKVGANYSFIMEGGEQNNLQLYAGANVPLDDWANFTRYSWYNDMSLSGAVRSGSDKIKCHRLRVYSPGIDSQDFDFYPQGYIKARSYNAPGVNGYWGIESVGGNLTPFFSTTTTMDGGWNPIATGAVIATQGYETRTALGTISNGASGWGRSVIKMLGDTAYHRAFEFNSAGDITTWAQSPGDAWGGEYIFSKNPNSDRDLKKDIIYTNGRESYDRVMQWLPSMFKYKKDDIQRYGLIAQDLLKVDPQYVKLVPGSPVFEDVMGINEKGEEYVDHQIETGVTDDTLSLDSNVMLVDMACAMVYMGNKMSKLEQELEQLKQAVTALTSV